MIDLTVPGHAEPEQDRNEIARLLKEYGVGAVCLLRNGSVAFVKDFHGYHFEEPYDLSNGIEVSETGEAPQHANDIIRVFPPGTRLRVTVEVAE